MIINHNMASLNTYRQLSTNNANSAKALEKLSSGLRINKAGDDAAGLAISEKMRGQIRGLDQSVRNSQDAISMIQTAEGSLSETHSILQRMKELATQAANDTNTTDDRGEIQKEINQLTSEINRIGNTTEFNTKKLLDGTIALSGSARQLGETVSYSANTLSNLSVDPNASAATGDYKITVENLGGITTQVVSASQTNTTGKAMTVDEAGTATDVGLAEGNYKVHIESASSKSTNTIVGTTVLDTTGGNNPITVDANSSLADTVAAQNYSVDVTKNRAYNATSVSGGGISAVDADSDPANIATEGTYLISTKAAVQTNNVAVIETGGALSNVEIAENSTYANATGYKIVVTQTDGDETDGNIGFTFQLQDSTNAVIETASTTVTNSAGSTQIQLGDITFDLDNAKMWASDATGDGTEGSFHNNTVALTIGNEVEVTQAATSDKKSSGFIADGANVASQVFTFTDGGKLAMTVTDSANEFVRGNNFSTTVSYDDTWTVQMNNIDGSDRGDAVTLTESDLVNGNIRNIQIGSAGDGVQIDFDAAQLNAMTAGAGGTQSSTFKVGTSTELTATIQKADGSAAAGAGSYAMTGTTAADVVDLGFDIELNYDGTDKAAGDIYFSVKDSTTADDFRMSLTRDIDGNGSYETTDVNQQAFNRGDTVNLGSTGITIDTDVAVTDNTTSTFSIENGSVDKSLSMQIGANQGQSFSVDISDMRAKALNISGASSDATNAGVTDAAFTSNKSATNGTNNTAEEYALDVSTHEKASAAIKVLDNAINTVSAERSKLGAFTNRLEHTITNLGTSSENLTAAESRIRDVDMAKEMMNFQKNNILSQAAQAMLAQANQQPQGVLQLLR